MEKQNALFPITLVVDTPLTTDPALYERLNAAVKAAQATIQQAYDNGRTENTQTTDDTESKTNISTKATTASPTSGSPTALDKASRKKLAAQGAALPDGSFPIKNETDLHNAISDYGRAGSKKKVKAHIISRANALNLSDKLPPNWSTKEVTPTNVWDMSKIKSGKSLLQKLAAALDGIIGVPAAPLTTTVDRNLAIIKEASGKTRFFIRGSAAVTDKHSEYIKGDTHKEYIDWADKTQNYPELWLWHTKGTKFGQADWLDFQDGFLLVSGTIDPGFEPLAEQLTLDREPVGVSHGFIGRFKADGEIAQYRSYEFSVLPRNSAAIPWTDFNLADTAVTKELSEMNPTKRKWLIEHGVKEEAIAALEKSTTDMAESLSKLGVAFKESEADATTLSGNTPASNTVVSGTEALLTSQLNDLTSAVKTLADTIAPLNERLTASEKAINTLAQGDEAKIEAYFKAATAKLPLGIDVNSSAPSSGDAATQLLARNTQANAPAEDDWFSKVVLSGITGISNGA